MPRLKAIFGAFLSLTMIYVGGCASNPHVNSSQANGPASVNSAPSQTVVSADITPKSPAHPLIHTAQPLVLASHDALMLQDSQATPSDETLLSDKAATPGYVMLVSDSDADNGATETAVAETETYPQSSSPQSSSPQGSSSQSSSEQDLVTSINLPSALAAVSGQHPVVGFAQWRVQEAYAQLQRAQVMWLPTIQSGFSYRRHDGNYQAVDGTIVDVDLNSFHYGLGMGATAAGTPTRPGLIAEFHLADAIFAPRVAQKTAWARGHAANAAMNQQLLHAATAYIDLLDAHQDARIVEESRSRMADLAKVTSDFAAAGQGLRADADRTQTELLLIDHRLVGARERIAVASARMIQVLSLDLRGEILPMDATAVPLDMTVIDVSQSDLISTGLRKRPELKEAQALVSAACDAYQREKYAPLVPSVLLGFSTGAFGGGNNNDLDNVDGRYDIDALMSWELRNLGYGEQAARRASSARIQQTRYEQLRVMDQVAFEISEAYSQVKFRKDQIELSQQAIQAAQASYERNRTRIREGQGLPLEVLQSVQAIESASRTYLRAISDHNEAQVRLQWALGWPVEAPVNLPSEMAE